MSTCCIGGAKIFYTLHISKNSRENEKTSHKSKSLVTLTTISCLVVMVQRAMQMFTEISMGDVVDTRVAKKEC